MRLGDVLNKIFRKRKSDELIHQNEKPAEDIYKPTEHHVEDDSRFKKVSENIVAEQGTNEMTLTEKLAQKSRFIIIGAVSVAVLAIIALGGVIYMRISASAFKENTVSISVDGPEVVSIGEKIEYKITVENKNRIKLNDVSISLDIPSNFEIQENNFIVDKNLSGSRIQVGELKGKSKKIYKLEALVNYSRDTSLLLKAAMKYKPNNTSSFFQTLTSKNIHLIESDIRASIISTNEVSAGELMELIIVVQNKGDKPRNNLSLEVEYPKGFTFESSTLDSKDENHKMWTINQLAPKEKRELKIFGRIIGRVNEVKKFKVSILENKTNILSEGENVVKIIPSKVILRQTSDKKDVSPGDFVTYTIFFKNNSTTSLHNLILKTHLPGKFIEKENLKTSDGYYNDRENTITWKASELKSLQELKQGEEGEVNFSVQIQKEILPNNGENNNPYIRIYSEIESLELDSPIFENKRVVSQKIKTLINSKLQLAGSIKYLPEDNNNEAEEGSLQVDKKIFLRVSLELKNTTNNLKNVELSAYLPAGVSWEKQIYPTGDNLKFNSQSNKIKWKMGVVKADTGFAIPAEKAEFLIGVTPSTNQVGHDIDLIKDIHVDGLDIFTGNNIEYMSNVVKSGIVKGLKSGAVIE